MKTRDRRRLRKRNVAWLDAMLNDGLPRRERITLAMRLVSGMRSGGKRGDAKARAKSLRAVRITGLAPLRADVLQLKADLAEPYWDTDPRNRLIAGGGASTSADAVAHQLWRRLEKPHPLDDLAREIAGRRDLWPSGIPSRVWFRAFVASVSDEEWEDALGDDYP